MPKPWADKDPTPYQGGNDNDGKPIQGTQYEKSQGEVEFRTPNPDPGGNSASRKPGGIA